MQYVLMHLVVCAISCSINAADNVSQEDRSVIEGHRQQFVNISNLVLQLPAYDVVDLFFKLLFIERDLSHPETADLVKVADCFRHLNLAVCMPIVQLFKWPILSGMHGKSCSTIPYDIKHELNHMRSYITHLKKINSDLLALPQCSTMALFCNLLSIEREYAKRNWRIDNASARNARLQYLEKIADSGERYDSYVYLASLCDWINLQGVMQDIKSAHAQAPITKTEHLVEQAQVTYLDLWKKGKGCVEPTNLPKYFSDMSVTRLLEHAKKNCCLHLLIKSSNDLQYTTLNLSSQYFASLEGIEQIPNPELCGTLFLSTNKISVVPSFNKLINLSKLSLNHNMLTTFPSVLKTLKKLKILELQNNYITEFSLAEEGFNSLEVLNLADNLITSLSSRMGGFPQLKSLNLSHNHIDHLPFAIQGLSEKKLCTIDLTENDKCPTSALLDLMKSIHDTSPHVHLLF